MSVKRWDESTYYEILEVDPSATGREIHLAYMRAKDTYSPDSPALYTMFTPEEARELMKMIDEAFAILSNQGRRAEYDLGLARRGHPSFAGLLRREPSKPEPAPKPTPVKAATKAVAATEAAPATPLIVGEEGAVLKVTHSPSGGSNLPEGFARTRFGVYEVNSKLENEMATIEECDGTFIQKIRQYKKVNFDQLSEATRISKTFLAAIEANAFDALPAPVFVRGFVLQIARTLGVPDRLADAYMKRFRKNLA